MHEHVRPGKYLSGRWLFVLGALLAVVLLAVALSACGSGGSSTTTNARDATTVGAATTSTELGPSGFDPLKATQYVISASGGKLSKTSIDVPNGAAVLFENSEDDTSTQHEFVADDGSFDTGPLSPGAQFIVTLSKGGNVAFHDKLHPDLKGTIVVSTTNTVNRSDVIPVPGLWVGVGNGKVSVTTIQLKVGDTINFFNAEKDANKPHEIVADDGSFDTGVLKTTGAFYTVTFQKSGTFGFHDKDDPSLKGTITVK